MKTPSGRCACGAPATKRCTECNAPLCDDHVITGINAKGQPVHRCSRCDREWERRFPSWWPDNQPG